MRDSERADHEVRECRNAERLAGAGPVTTRTTAYDWFGRATTVTESVTDAGGTVRSRTTATVFDFSGYADRTKSQAVTGGLGAAVPARSFGYDPATGAQTTVSSTAGTLTSGFDDFGRVISYAEPGSTTTTNYDTAGRVATISDGKGSRTYGYNAGGERRGLATSLTVSGVGTITGLYGSGGELVSQSLPSGVDQAWTRDETGTPVRLAVASGGVTWYSDEVASSVHGQVRTHAGPLSEQTYGYDALGRLTGVEDAQVGGGCATRGYRFDVDTNRTGLDTWPSADDGTCQTTTGKVIVSHGYDAADRLQPSGVDAGLVYDAFGRITTLPATGTADPGAGAVSVGYYATDLVASISRGGTTTSYGLDPAARRATATTIGTGAGVRADHYGDASSDSPSWTATNSGGTTWARNAGGLDGALAATVDQAGTITWQLADLHGDIVATATGNATVPDGFYDTDEYGTPTTATPGRYGWLGGHQRATDATTGIVLMGVRLYAPTLGRFLQVDPVAGGSANAYDYCNADPVNCLDLDGKFAWALVAFVAVDLTPAGWVVVGALGAYAAYEGTKAGISYAKAKKQKGSTKPGDRRQKNSGKTYRNKEDAETSRE